jgi:hypothetical protein
MMIQIEFFINEEISPKKIMKTSKLNLIIDHKYIGGFIHF